MDARPDLLGGKATLSATDPCNESFVEVRCRVYERRRQQLRDRKLRHGAIVSPFKVMIEP
jgi:hypothetical protein